MEYNSKICLTGFPKELRLLLEFMKEEPEKDLVCEKETLFDVNWNEFYKLTLHHRVYPWVYHNIRNNGIDFIPVNFIQKISSLYQTNRFKMLFLSGEMELLSRLFSKNEIKTIFLKGPVLGLDLYGDVSLRTSSDLDLLVPLKDLKKAEKLLIKEGFVKDDYISSVLNDWKWRHHHFTFFHSEKKIKVEIHWRLNPGPAKEISFADLWKRKRISNVSNFPIYMLSKEDIFLFLVTHGSRHGWSRLRWLQDIDQLTKKVLDWEVIFQLSRKYQIAQLVGQALILSSNLLGTKLIGKMQLLTNGYRPKRLAQDALFYIKQKINLHTEPQPKEIALYHRHHLFVLMSFRQKLLFLLSFFYPYSIDAETFPLPKNLHFLYFPLRPFLCVWRISKKALTP